MIDSNLRSRSTYVLLGHALLGQVLLGSLLVSLAACGGGTEAAASPAKPDAPAKTAVLRFTGIPNENTTELKAKYQPLADHLSKTLGVTVEYVPVADYAASVDAFKNGDILLCWFGGYTGLQARQAVDRKSTRLNSSHWITSRMPSSA